MVLSSFLFSLLLLLNGAHAGVFEYLMGLPSAAEVAATSASPSTALVVADGIAALPIDIQRTHEQCQDISTRALRKACEVYRMEIGQFPDSCCEEHPVVDPEGCKLSISKMPYGSTKLDNAFKELDPAGACSAAAAVTQFYEQTLKPTFAAMQRANDEVKAQYKLQLEELEKTFKRSLELFQEKSADQNAALQRLLTKRADDLATQLALARDEAAQQHSEQLSKLSDLTAGVDAVKGDVHRVETGVSDLSQALSTVNATVRRVETSVAAKLESTAARIDDELKQMGSKAEANTAALAAIARELVQLASQLRTTNTSLAIATTDVGGLKESIGAIGAALYQLQSAQDKTALEVEQLRETTGVGLDRVKAQLATQSTVLQQKIESEVGAVKGAQTAGQAATDARLKRIEDKQNESLWAWFTSGTTIGFTAFGVVAVLGGLIVLVMITCCCCMYRMMRQPVYVPVQAAAAAPTPVQSQAAQQPQPQVVAPPPKTNYVDVPNIRYVNREVYEDALASANAVPVYSSNMACPEDSSPPKRLRGNPVRRITRSVARGRDSPQ